MATKTKTPTDNGAIDKGEQSTEARLMLRIIPNRIIRIRVEAISDLIIHRWSEKAKKEMLEAQTGPKTRAKKEPRDIEQEYMDAFYKMEDGRNGFPAIGFKAATIGAVRLFDGLPMTLAKRVIFVKGYGRDELVEIEGEPYMREDVVRLENGVAMLRYRPAFHGWAATLEVEYKPSILSREDVVALVNEGGSCGVGEWRPAAKKSEVGGPYGRFRVTQVAE